MLLVPVVKQRFVVNHSNEITFIVSALVYGILVFLPVLEIGTLDVKVEKMSLRNIHAKQFM